MRDWKLDAIEQGRKRLVRKEAERLRAFLYPADDRARTRTAKERQAAELAALQGPTDIPLPDADDSSIYGMLR